MLKVEQLKLEIGGNQILQGVDFQVREGESVGIIGPNGSGKTTLFNSISGFLKSSSGNIDYLGHKLLRYPPHKRAKLGIGRGFQNFGIFREMTVLENMLIALEANLPWWRGLLPTVSSKGALYTEAREMLATVGLADKIDHSASQLSGGQARLLEIIRLVAFGSRLFLLDEPTAGVSPKMKGEIANLIRSLGEQGKTILVIEHDLNFIQSFCERIIVMDMGKVVLEGSPEEIRADPMLQRIYFGDQSSSAVSGESRESELV